MENEDVLDKIERMFRSGDRQLIKLAQKLCHQKRIDYYIISTTLGYTKSLKYVATIYTVNKDLFIIPSQRYTMLYHKINLNRDGRKS